MTGKMSNFRISSGAQWMLLLGLFALNLFPHGAWASSNENARSLRFSNQPEASYVSGEPFSVAVELRDSRNRRAKKECPNTISIQLSSCSGASLSGSTIATVRSCLATFSGLSINRNVGVNGCKLRASAEKFSPQESRPFNIESPTPTSLKITAGLTRFNSGQPVSFTVSVRDELDRAIGFIGTVNLGLSRGGSFDPSSQTSLGFRNQSSRDFTNIKIETTGGFTLSASASASPSPTPAGRRITTGSSGTLAINVTAPPPVDTARSRFFRGAPAVESASDSAIYVKFPIFMDLVRTPTLAASGVTALVTLQNLSSSGAYNHTDLYLIPWDGNCQSAAPAKSGNYSGYRALYLCWKVSSSSWVFNPSFRGAKITATELESGGTLTQNIDLSEGFFQRPKLSLGSISPSTLVADGTSRTVPITVNWLIDNTPVSNPSGILIEVLIHGDQSSTVSTDSTGAASFSFAAPTQPMIKTISSNLKPYPLVSSSPRAFHFGVPLFTLRPSPRPSPLADGHDYYEVTATCGSGQCTGSTITSGDLGIILSPSPTPIPSSSSSLGVTFTNGSAKFYVTSFISGQKQITINGPNGTLANLTLGFSLDSGCKGKSVFPATSPSPGPVSLPSGCPSSSSIPTTFKLWGAGGGYGGCSLLWPSCHRDGQDLLGHCNGGGGGFIQASANLSQSNTIYYQIGEGGGGIGPSLASLPLPQKSPTIGGGGRGATAGGGMSRLWLSNPLSSPSPAMIAGGGGGGSGSRLQAPLCGISLDGNDPAPIDLFGGNGGRGAYGEGGSGCQWSESGGLGGSNISGGGRGGLIPGSNCGPIFPWPGQGPAGSQCIAASPSPSSASQGLSWNALRNGGDGVTSALISPSGARGEASGGGGGFVGGGGGGDYGGAGGGGSNFYDSTLLVLPSTTPSVVSGEDQCVTRPPDDPSRSYYFIFDTQTTIDATAAKPMNSGDPFRPADCGRGGSLPTGNPRGNDGCMVVLFGAGLQSATRDATESTILHLAGWGFTSDTRVYVGSEPCVISDSSRLPERLTCNLSRDIAVGGNQPDFAYVAVRGYTLSGVPIQAP